MHKNKSFLIIPKALFLYFVHGLAPEYTITENKNIFNFCGGVKIKGDWKFIEHKINNGQYIKDDLQHTIRYFVSTTGSKIVKTHLLDGRETQVEAGKWMQTVFIDYEEKHIQDYNIDYRFYIEKVNKEIKGLEPKSQQLSLF